MITISTCVNSTCISGISATVTCVSDLYTIFFLYCIALSNYTPDISRAPFLPLTYALMVPPPNLFQCAMASLPALLASDFTGPEAELRWECHQAFLRDLNQAVRARNHTNQSPRNTPLATAMLLATSAFVNITLEETAKTAAVAPPNDLTLLIDPPTISSPLPALNDSDEAVLSRAARGCPKFQSTLFTASDVYTVDAWDCSLPRLLHPVQARSRARPCHAHKFMTGQVNVTYDVLQEAQFTRTTGKRCVLVESTIPVYCGHYDHQTMILPHIRLMQPKSVMAEECRRLWRSGKVMSSRKEAFQVSRNGTTDVYLEPVSKTYVKGEVECVDQTTHFNGKQVDDVVIGVYRRFTLETAKLKIGADGHMVDASHGMSLPCRRADQECLTNTGTYLWTDPTPADSCPLFRTRTSQGLKIADSAQGSTFISQDGTLVRLQVHPAISRCGRLVHPTNHRRVFLTAKLNDSILSRPLPVDEHSELLYVNIADSYIHSSLTQTINTEIRDVERKVCQMQNHDAALDYSAVSAEQRTATDGEVTRLSGDSYIARVGEAWLKFQCQPFVVRARVADACYSSLPVSVQPNDLPRILASRKDANNTAIGPDDFFVDPHTRVLHTRGIKQECSTEMPSMYRMRSGQWVRVSPHLTLTPEPQLLESYDLTSEDSDDASPALTVDFEFGCVYDKDAVD